MSRRYQLVWSGARLHFGFVRDRHGLGRIYAWRLGLGPLEFRRWRTLEHSHAHSRREPER